MALSVAQAGWEGRISNGILARRQDGKTVRRQDGKTARGFKTI